MALVEFTNNQAPYINAENLNNNFNELNKINSIIDGITLNTVSVTTDTTKEVGNYTIAENGTYLICGNIAPNYYNQSGRELNFTIKKNNTPFYVHNGVISGAYVFSSGISTVTDATENDIFTFEITNTDNTKSWAFVGGTIYFVKLK